MLKRLKAAVFDANLEVVRRGLVLYTWGNASGIDRKRGLVVIKPSGVPYETMKAADMVVVDLDGKIVEGKYSPSSDTPTHLVLYRAFPQIGGIVHTHSRSATAWAQAQREIPCLGTTHADSFHGPVPVTAPLSEAEILDCYEENAGHSIVRRFASLDPLAVPAVLLAGHAPFAWGRSPAEAARNAVVLEEVAALASETLAIHSTCGPIPDCLRDKHFLRKHGKGAYYGQTR
ncbi:MAG: L-ribulose-5-phosphate 4-epimerase [Bryobacterales bacterium]|nr:L-ribulose-5-phosphate 4-epimerase [Bryobacterales bacterium]